MSGHTPGPWTANTESDHGDFIVWGPGDDEFVANVGTEPDAHPGIVAFDVSKANARLIAAAPDLLMRCIARVEHCICAMPRPTHYGDLYGLPGLCNECNADLAAIAKAEGK